jgi:hypothetical protein
VEVVVPYIYVELVSLCINQIHFVRMGVNSIRVGFETIHCISISKIQS